MPARGPPPNEADQPDEHDNGGGHADDVVVDGLRALGDEEVADDGDGCSGQPVPPPCFHDRTNLLATSSSSLRARFTVFRSTMSGSRFRAPRAAGLRQATRLTAAASRLLPG